MSDLRAAFRKKIEPRLRDIMETAGEIVTERLREKISRPYLSILPTSILGITETKDASIEGEYPRKRTGSLEESIDFQTYLRGEKVYLKYGSMHDTMLNGQTQRPTIYARVLEHGRQRRFARAIWDDPTTKRMITMALKSKAKPQVKANDLSSVVRTSAAGSGASMKYAPVE